MHDLDSERTSRVQKPTSGATRDVLAAAPDRAFFEDRLTSELAHADGRGEKVIVALLNFDRFRETNDVLGRKVADQLLQDVARRLETRLRRSDTVTRLDGDEFLLLLPRIIGTEDVKGVAKRILRIFQQPFLLGDLRFRVTTNVGLAVYPDHGKDAEGLMRNVVLAMYRARQRGRNNYQCFNSTTDAT